MEQQRQLRAFKVTPSAKVATYRSGRVCAVAGCDVRLSRYNPGVYCGVHTPPDYRIPRLRDGRRSA